MRNLQKILLTTGCFLAALTVYPQKYGASCAAAGGLTGDVNEDGIVSIEDAQMTLLEYVNSMAGMKSGLTAEQSRLADVNSDGTVSIEDAQYILLYYVMNSVTGSEMTWEQILHPVTETTAAATTQTTTATAKTTTATAKTITAKTATATSKTATTKTATTKTTTTKTTTAKTTTAKTTTAKTTTATTTQTTAEKTTETTAATTTAQTTTITTETTEAEYLDAEVKINYPRPTGDPVLRQGSESGEVGWLQSALNRIMNAGISVDCNFGRQTDTAVRRFQSRCDLTADGQAGAMTLSKMLDILCGRMELPIKGMNILPDGAELYGWPTVCCSGPDNTAVLEVAADEQDICYTFDLKDGSLLRTIDIGSNNTLIGVFDDGTVVCANEFDKLAFYEPDSSVPKTIELDREEEYCIFKADPADECVYWLEDDKLICSMDKNGKYSELEASDIVYQIFDVIPEQNIFIAHYYSENARNGEKDAVFSLDTGEWMFDIVDCYEYGVTKDKFFEYTTYNGDMNRVVLRVYDLAQKCYEKKYEYAAPDRAFTAIGGINSNRILLTEYDMISTSDLLAVKELDLDNGNLSDLDLDLNDMHCTMARSAGNSDCGCCLLAMYCFENNTEITTARSFDSSAFKYAETLQANTEPLPVPKTYEVGEDYLAVREEADKIEKEFGIEILVGDEVFNAELKGSYPFVSNETILSPEEAIEDLNALREHLSVYPDDFFEHFKSPNDKFGLRISLVNHFETLEGTTFTAGGLAFRKGRWYDIAVDESCVEDTSTVHHEMWHTVENLLAEKKEFDSSNWEQLNPEYFFYVYDTELYMSGAIDGSNTLHNIMYETPVRYNDAYFAYQYSMINDKEDRATLIESLFSNWYTWYWYDGTERLSQFSQYPHLQAKLDYLASCSEKEFGYVYWEEMLNQMKAPA